jgi:hypothetical protein
MSGQGRLEGAEEMVGLLEAEASLLRRALAAKLSPQ